MRMTKWAAVAALGLSTVACGGGKAKINYAKLNTTKRVAIVGVCQPTEVVATRGGTTVRVDIGNDFVNPLAAGLDAAFAAAWSGVEIVPFAAVATNTSVPRRELWHRRRCAGGFDPMMPKGYAGDADRAYMADLANKLGVDATVAVSWQPAIRLDGANLKAFAGTFNAVSFYVVDKSGEQIALVTSKGLDGEYIPMAPSEAAAYAPAAMSFARVAAQDFVAKLRNP